MDEFIGENDMEEDFDDLQGDKKKKGKKRLKRKKLDDIRLPA